MTTQNLGLKTQDYPISGRSCGGCDCAARVLHAPAEMWMCANHPDYEGRLVCVPSAGEDVASRCQSFRFGREAPPLTDVPRDKVRYIGLPGGVFVIVDAADYEWLRRYHWRAGGNGSGYAYCRLEGKVIPMHRLIMNPPPDKVVDHISGNPWDNRRGNLRVCTQAENARNRRKRSGTSRFKGVRWNRSTRKWVAQICHLGKTTYLGSFDDEVEAAKAYDRAAAERFGEFARLNFPPKRLVLLKGTAVVHSRTRGRTRAGKSEFRNPKSETDSKGRNSKLEEGRTRRGMPTLSLRTRPSVGLLAEEVPISSPDVSTALRSARHDRAHAMNGLHGPAASRGPPG
jgi:hypothetical protein